MEVKKLCNYSGEEKKKILLQWWYSDWKKRALVKELARYELDEVIGESCSIDGMINFMRAAENYPDILLKTAAADYEFGDSSDKAARAMLNGKFYDYCTLRAQIYDQLKDTTLFSKSMDNFLHDVVGRYNRDFCDGEQLVDRILCMSLPYTELKMNRLSVSNIETLYNRCVLKTSDLDKGRFEGDFTVGEGIKGESYFNTDKLNFSSDEIMGMISQLPEKVKDGISFDEFCVTDEGYKWGNERVAEMLIRLGNACGFLYFPAPREDWQYLPGGMPYIAATGIEKKVIPGKKEWEYVKTRDSIKKGDSV